MEPEKYYNEEELLAINNTRQISPEEQHRLKTERLNRLQGMGMNHIPQAPVNMNPNELPLGPNGLPVRPKDPRMLAIFEQIKSGSKRKEFEKIVHRDDKSLFIPENTNMKKGQGRHNPNIQRESTKVNVDLGPEPQTRIDSQSAGLVSEAESIANMFGDSNPRNSRQPSVSQIDRHNLSLDTGPDDGGASFTKDLKSQFAKTTQEKLKQQQLLQQQQMQQQPYPGYVPAPGYPAQPYQQYPYPVQPISGQQYPPQQIPNQPYPNPTTVPHNQPYVQPVIPQGMIVINEEDLKKKIINISSQIVKKYTEAIAEKVSEQMIRKVLSEYVKQPKPTLNETSNIKQAEVIGNNTVKIDGQVYTLVPKKKVGE